MSSDIDFKRVTRANVYLRGELAGTLEKRAERDYLFEYDSEYLERSRVQIAISFPTFKKSYPSHKLHSFFDNLITEGWLLQHTEKVFHIDKSNRFALLMATGKDPIGAVTIHPLDSHGDEIDLETIFKHDLEREKLSPYANQIIPSFARCPSCFRRSRPGMVHLKCAKEMWGTTKRLSVELDPSNPQNSFARLIYGGSISGAQKKGMFRLDPSKGLLTPTPSGAQYILKPNGDYPELPENEHVTMAIAKALKFEVPPFSVLSIEGVGVIFAIQRFDRMQNEPLMMEDMGQVISVPSADKYQSSCEKVAAAISRYSSAPVIDLNKYFRRLVFCYFIGNGDMHLKNWSLLENRKAKGVYNLSPCYDLLNTRLPIPGERIDIGLTIGGKASNLKKSYFVSLGRKMNLSENAIQRVFNEIDNWRTVTEDFVSACLLSDESKQKYLEIVSKRLDVLTS